MIEEMKKAAEKAIAFQRDCIKDGKESFSHGILYKDDGTVNIYAFDLDFMSDYRKKNQISLVMLKELIAHGGVFAFCSDGWSGKLPEGKTRKDMPDSLADWPEEYRSEVILCFVNKIGEKGITAQQFYKRENGKLITEDIRYPDDAVGRFVFDLTGDNIIKESNHRSYIKNF